MRFAWTDDQLAFAEAARDLLAKECPPAVVRAAGEAPAGALDRGVWDSLAEMGVTGLLAPEGSGGLGLDECFAVPVLEESGRAGLPHPLVDTVCVAAPLGALAAASDAVVATDLGGPLVACAADADAFVLTAGDPGDPGECCAEGDVLGLPCAQHSGLYLVERGAVAVEQVATVDRGRRAGRVTWSPADGTLLTDDPAAVALAVDRGVVGTAAQLCGLARAMLDLTVAYVGERRQFGVPIGSFQAVKHHLADALLRLEFARPAVARAAWTLAQGPAVAPTVRGRDASMAKALATDAVEACGRAALQCHGAIGYTVEHDLHLYLKRSWALARTWGDRDAHTRRVGRALDALAADPPADPARRT